MPTPADLFAAIDAGDPAAVDALLAADPALAATVADDGISAVLKACYAWQFEIAARLGEAKASAGDLDILEAAALGRADDVRVILAADPAAVRAWSADGFTALHYAAFFGGLETAQALIAAGADVTAPSRNPMAVLPQHSAAAGQKADVVAALLDAGVPVDAPSQGGFTVLHSAAQNGDAAFVDMLLERGANPACKTEDGRSAADLAAAAGHEPLAVLLRRATP